MTILYIGQTLNSLFQASQPSHRLPGFPKPLLVLVLFTVIITGVLFATAWNSFDMKNSSVRSAIVRPPVRNPLPPGNVPFDTVDQFWDSRDRYNHTLTAVVNDPASLTSVWAHTMCHQELCFEGPHRTNFTEHTVLAVFLGERPTTGYYVNITSVISTGTEIIVTFVVTIHGGNWSVAPFPSGPYHIIEIPRTDQYVSFVEQTKRVNCGVAVSEVNYQTLPDGTVAFHIIPPQYGPSSPPSILWLSDAHGYRESSFTVINDRARMCVIWTRAFCTYSEYICEPSPYPSIDFAKRTVIADFMGEKPTGGYSTKITNVTSTGPSIRVDVSQVIPGPNCNVSQAITYPWDMVDISKTNQQILFQTHTSITNC